MTAEALAARGLWHSYGELPVFKGLELSVARGEFLAIVGPSGCGKSTLLSLLASFEPPQRGAILRHGVVRTVFQQDGLFPWLTIEQNVEQALPPGGDPSDRRAAAVRWLRMVGLEDFASSYPRQLSGGMRQRSQLARVLAGEPDIILLDEPFSSLDYLTRVRMRAELSQVLASRPATVVLVTHDIEEAVELADRILVLGPRGGAVRMELPLGSPRPRRATSRDALEVLERVRGEFERLDLDARPVQVERRPE